MFVNRYGRNHDMVQISQRVEANVDSHVIALIYNLLNMFNFKNRLLSDVLNCFSKKYVPLMERNRMILLYGLTRSGKSFMNGIISDIHKESTFGVDQTLGTTRVDSNGRSPASIQHNKKYLIVVSELSGLYAGYLKVITGNDCVDKRYLSSNEFHNTRNFAMMLGASNAYPNIVSAAGGGLGHRDDTPLGEEIRQRLVVIPMKRQVVQAVQNVVDTPLTTYTNNCVMPLSKVEEQASAVYSPALSNLVYAKHYANLDCVNSWPEPESDEINDEIMNVMAKKSQPYKVLKEADVVFMRGHKIKIEDMRPFVVKNVLTDNDINADFYDDGNFNRKTKLAIEKAWANFHNTFKGYVSADEQFFNDMCFRSVSLKTLPAHLIDIKQAYGKTFFASVNTSSKNVFVNIATLAQEYFEPDPNGSMTTLSIAEIIMKRLQKADVHRDMAEFLKLYRKEYVPSEEIVRCRIKRDQIGHRMVKN